MSSLGFIAMGAAQAAIEAHVPTLVTTQVASRISNKDTSIWVPSAREEAATRLGWIDAPSTSRALLPAILALRDELRAEGVNRIVLAGMGGSSLAPEVICATNNVELVVADSTDPEMLAGILTDRLATTALVVSSKSGSTVETDSQRRVFEQAFNDAGINAARRIIVVTDPGSPMDEASRAAGYRAVFNADPNVGGRYSALTAFGLVPAGLAGVDIAAFLDEAADAAEFLAEDDEDNIALALGAAMAGTVPLRDKLIFSDEGSGLVGFADWAEQLIAESTGKSQRGVLPVVVEAGSPETTSAAADFLQIRLVADTGLLTDDELDASSSAVALSGALGAQMLLWEYATVIAGHLLEIDPFNQPDVEAAKVAARSFLDATPEDESPLLVEGAIEVSGSADLLAGVNTLTEALNALLAAMPSNGYLAVQTYLNRHADGRLEELRPLLAAATDRPVTFGWGPRFLHSTGQFHKGGPRVGAYLQLSAESTMDLSIPGRDFTFGELLAAQSSGDAHVLTDLGRPVLRLHLRDKDAGIRQLEELVRNLATA